MSDLLLKAFDNEKAANLPTVQIGDNEMCIRDSPLSDGDRVSLFPNSMGCGGWRQPPAE